MYSLAQDHAIDSSALWVWMLTSREIATAISLLEEVGAVLVSLVDDSNWQSEGFRALHDLLARLREDTGAEMGTLRVREWELNAGGAE
jgi:hypothetical protein